MIGTKSSAGNGIDASRPRVLIIEDEPLIALDLQEALIQVGADVVGVAATVEQALLAVAAPNLTAAIVDLRLNGQSVRDAVQQLADRANRVCPPHCESHWVRIQAARSRRGERRAGR